MSAGERYRQIALVGLLGATSVVLGILENFLPIPFPGVRLGLANLGPMIMLYTGGVRYAFAVMILKTILVPVFSGNPIFRLTLSVPSGLAAFLGMLISVYVLRKASAVSSGVLAATCHMLTQLWIIDKLYIRGIFDTAFLGWFMLVAAVTGLITGLITNLAVNRFFADNLFCLQKKV